MFLRDIECGAVVQGNGISRLSNVLSVCDVVLEVRTDISCIVVCKYSGSPSSHELHQPRTGWGATTTRNIAPSQQPHGMPDVRSRAVSFSQTHHPNGKQECKQELRNMQRQSSLRASRLAPIEASKSTSYPTAPPAANFYLTGSHLLAPDQDATYRALKYRIACSRLVRSLDYRPRAVARARLSSKTTVVRQVPAGAA